MFAASTAGRRLATPAPTQSERTRSSICRMRQWQVRRGLAAFAMPGGSGSPRSAAFNFRATATTGRHDGRNGVLRRVGWVTLAAYILRHGDCRRCNAKEGFGVRIAGDSENQ